MLANTTVVRSTGARTVFLVSAALTACITVWTRNLGIIDTSGLSPIFTFLFATQDHYGANGALIILVAAMLVRRQDSFLPLLRWIDARAKLIAAVTFVVLCLGTLLVYRNQPLSMDEYSVYFQSRVFAAGHLTGQFPLALKNWLVPREFQHSFLYTSPATGQVISGYWPSFSLLLTPFTVLGIPWACNPAISACTLLVIHQLAMRIFASRETAGLALLFTLFSPVFFADGISYYSMSAHLLTNSLYALLLLEPTPRRALLAGVVGSIALTLHNPMPHALFALPWIIWLLTRPRGIVVTLALIAGYLPLSLLLGVGWFIFATHLLHGATTTGTSDVFTEGLNGRTSHTFSFPTAAIIMSRVIGVAKVVVWAVPGLILLACVGAWQWRHNRACQLLTASALTTLLGYLFVTVDQGHGWGFRYFHSAWLALPLLAAGALTPTPGQQRPSIFHDADTRNFVAACALLAVVGEVGLRAWQIRLYIDAHLEQQPTYADAGRRIEILDTHTAFYGHDLVQNDPWLREDVVRMITNGRKADNAMMAQSFPGWHRVALDQFGSVWIPDSK